MNTRYALILLLSFTTLHAGAAPETPAEYYCIPDDVEYGECIKGDLTVVLSADDALMVCDFGKEIIPASRDHFICYYRGAERVRRSRQLSNEKAIRSE
jgi:hypothetical protein